MSGPLEHEPLDWVDVVAARELVDARLALHWAAQVASAAGATLAEAAPDYSHTSLHWTGASGMLAGAPVAGGRRAALRIRDLCVVVLGPDGETTGELSLAARTLDEALSWLGEELGGELQRPTHDLPPHPVADGAPFETVQAAPLEQLARWFGNASRMLEAVRGTEGHPSPTRCWPHHFDIATLIALDPGEADAEKARSIGVGMTPGDGSIAVPYFYVTPWPYPAATDLPALAGGGRWNTAGWVGALLRAEDLREGDAGEQGAQIAAFLRSAVDASRALLR